MSLDEYSRLYEMYEPFCIMAESEGEDEAFKYLKEKYGTTLAIKVVNLSYSDIDN